MTAADSLTPALSDHYEVIVVGAGQAGLAIGYHLAQRGRRFTLLDAAAEPGAAWRARWDSLKLFTPVRYDALPGLPFPGEPDSYPGRDQVADYLAEYVVRFDLPVQFNSRVRSIRPSDQGYLVDLDDRTYEADQVVLATGPFQVPMVPAIAERLDRDVVHFHSGHYRAPDQVPLGPVLVVGGGNTGYQIAEELARSHEVHLSIGSRQLPLPQRILGRDLFWVLEATRLMAKTRDSRIGRRAQQQDTLIGSSARALRRRHGVHLHPRTADASGSEVTFSDGTRLTVSSVIWATGFGLDFSWVELPVLDEQGRVVHRRGVTSCRGLYFLGLPWQHTRGSALLGWVKDDAEYIAREIDTVADAESTQAPRHDPPASPPEPAAQPSASGADRTSGRR